MKHRSVSFTPEAVEDLNVIYDWIAQAASEAVAGRFVERIERYCLGFDIASERGQLRGDRRGGLRSVGFNRQATILFRFSDDTVTIARIFRAGRDWSGLGLD